MVVTENAPETPPTTSTRVRSQGVRRAGSVAVVTVIKINAITVDAGAGDELARRFAARIGAVDNQDGFEGFELLQPTDERTTWLVVTRWRDEEAFQAWVSSPAFSHGHQGANAPHAAAQKPVAMSSELWSYAVAQTAAPQ